MLYTDKHILNFYTCLTFTKGLVVPSCPNLRPLKLVFRDDPYWKVLAAFLHGSSNLEDIVLEDVSNICVHLSYMPPNAAFKDSRFTHLFKWLSENQMQ